ncbi:D-alanine--D-alanine ligase [Brevibacillus marinus]|uniref:D-alanine--D-alanine ligase n=1 Tax=Brevibacillus marinus TaxID=2496837 RepID=UPI000F824B0B|nr:D-alanine--D-alanine ligase [Brevibacillus marinus]
MGRKIRLGIVYGGKSSEHEVSLRTALSIMQAVDPEKYQIVPIYIRLDGSWVSGEPAAALPNSVDALRLAAKPADAAAAGGGTGQLIAAGKQAKAPILGLTEQIDVIFPVVHGPNGEDGTVQGLLELADLPYVGSGVMASAIGMDKWMMKNVFAQAGLPQVRYLGILRSRLDAALAEVVQQIEDELGYPCFVKPANMGSSVGISKAKDRTQLIEGLKLAATFDRRLIVEAFVAGRELEIGVLGNEQPITSVVGEVIASKEFYDYEAKYKGAGTKLQIPANIPQHVADEIAALALRVYQAIDASGLSRVDFFWDEAADRLYVNEVNTMPGFTPYSMYPMLFAAAGIPYRELIDRLVALALERHADKQRNQIAAEALE